MECRLCGQPWKKDSNISFHSIPKNPVLRRQWIKVCNLQRIATKYHPKISSIRICSAHFDADSFFMPSKTYQRSYLKPNAVPKLGIFKKTSIQEKLIRKKSVQERKENKTYWYLGQVFKKHYISSHLDDMSNKKKVIEDDKTRIDGFKRGLEADKILGSADDNGELMYLMQWKGTDTVDIVPAREANIKCPQIVIRFYEDRLAWHKVKPSVK